MSRQLGGSCQVPLAAHATWDGDVLQLEAFVAMPDGSRQMQAQGAATVADAAQAEGLGERVAADLLSQGASEILAALAEPAAGAADPNAT